MSDKRRRLRIPKHIKLPFGCLVDVQQVSNMEWTEEYDRTYSDKKSDDCFAFCKESEERTVIYLDKSRGKRKMRADLLHELVHIVLDLQAATLLKPSVADPT